MNETRILNDAGTLNRPLAATTTQYSSICQELKENLNSISHDQQKLSASGQQLLSNGASCGTRKHSPV